MYDKETEFVPLNVEALSKNPAVWEVIKEEIQNLSGECLMKIVSEAKKQGMKDKQIFMPTVEIIEVEFSDPFKDSTEYDTEED
jgi:hypothetical protein